MIPSKGFILKKDYRENNKDSERNHFLNHLQFHQRKWATIFFEANPICRNLKNVFKQRNAPTDKNNTDQPQVLAPTHFLKFQMTVPREGHEGVGEYEQREGIENFHIRNMICGSQKLI